MNLKFEYNKQDKNFQKCEHIKTKQNIPKTQFKIKLCTIFSCLFQVFPPPKILLE
jgi:hypothetical protein